jgi:hypothetical protein
MTNLYDVLEICLNEIEHGADIDTVLFRYSEYADELRPILEASVKAREMTVPAPSQEIVRRNRAKVLQHVAQIREQKAAPSPRRLWSVPLRRALVTLMVIVVLFAGSTGLVRASSSTVPGDSLYPVKRTWEDVLVLLTFDPEKRDVLEFEHENERYEELHELLTEGRAEKVDFSGYVTRQYSDEWLVSGIRVRISPQTRVPDEPVNIGDAVRVKGLTQSGDSVLATEIKLLSDDSRLPAGNENETEFEEDNSGNSNEQNEEESGSKSGNETPKAEVTPTSTQETDRKIITLEGTVDSMEDKFIVINGILMDLRTAAIKGTPRVGVIAKAEGFYDTDGVFIVLKIEFKDTGSDSNDNNNGDNDNLDNDNDHDNDNHNDNDNNNDNSNDNNNDNDNDNSNDNSNDNDND